MSWYRKVKSIYTISFVTISFIIWSTLSNWLFQNPVEYKLFLICTCIVFFTQYITSLRLRKTIIITLTLGLSIIACVVFFKGQNILLNTIFLLIANFTIYIQDNAPIDYFKYKDDIKKSMALLLFIWIISFTLGLEFVDEIYKFHIIYIIMIIILMRETRRYEYDVNSKTSTITNIVIGVCVLTLSLDYAGKIVKGILVMLMNLVSFILGIIVNLLTEIFGGAISWISQALREFFMDRNTAVKTETIIHDNVDKPLNINKYNGIKLPPMLIFVFKIIILLIILYMMYKFLSRATSEMKTHNGFTEEKERIVKKNKKKHWAKKLFGKIFEGNGSNRDKVLYAYKGFEKTTEEAEIYKLNMTATQLKNVTKVYVDNFDDLDEMTQAYNEAKFSTHDITQEQVQQVKKGDRNIKKQL
jgi:hypothetical protein